MALPDRLAILIIGEIYSAKKEEFSRGSFVGMIDGSVAIIPLCFMVKSFYTLHSCCYLLPRHRNDVSNHGNEMIASDMVTMHTKPNRLKVNDTF